MKDTPKYPSSKRDGDVGETTSSKAPKNFKKPNKVNVIETLTALPSAKKTIECGSISSKIINEEYFQTLPQNYKQSNVDPEAIVEKKEEYVYKVPAGYEHIQPIITEVAKPIGDYVSELETRLGKLNDTSYESIDKLMKAICLKHGISPKKLHDDFKAKHNQIPDEWIDAQTPKEKPKNAIEKVAEQLKFERRKELTEEQREDSRDLKISNLEQQLRDLRKITLETAQGTIVSNLGAGSTGSGEVRINRMDDVDVRNIKDGATLVWDVELQKWIPSFTSDVALPGGSKDVIDRIEGIEDALMALQKLVMEHGPHGADDAGGVVHNHFGVIDVLTYEGTTDRSSARSVNLLDDSFAYIVAETSVDLDHFDILNDDNALLIEVESGTPFLVSNHEHLPDFVAYEKYTDQYGIARDIDFTDNTVLLLQLEETDNVHDLPLEDSIIVELEANTLTSPSQVAQIFGIEISTDTSSASEFNWNDDVSLISPEGTINPQDLSSAGEGTFLGLEDNIPGHSNVSIPGQTEISQQYGTSSKFFDEQPGGDVNRFRVTLEASRGVYQLDGISQPAIQIPRGDIIEFDLIAIDERDQFTIFASGSELTTEITRYPTLVSFDSSKIDTSVNKAYYRHSTKRGMGWLIVITDN